MGVPVFERSDLESFGISGEHENSIYWADYWNQNPKWIFGLHPAAEKVLSENGMFAEWETPGNLIVYFN